MSTPVLDTGLEKEAINFGATKALLGGMKNMGVRLMRTTSPAQFKPSIPGANNATINIPKGYQNPRSTLFHEFGHALDPKLNNTGGDVIQKFNALQAPNQLNLERTANSNAVGFMHKQNVPEPLVDQYKSNMAGGFGSYRMGYVQQSIDKNPANTAMIQNWRAGIKPGAPPTPIPPRPPATQAETALQQFDRWGYNHPGFDPILMGRIKQNILKKFVPDFNEQHAQLYNRDPQLLGGNSFTPKAANDQQHQQKPTSI
jgi:hypothetical protein